MSNSTDQINNLKIAIRVEQSITCIKCCGIYKVGWTFADLAITLYEAGWRSIGKKDEIAVMIACPTCATKIK